MDPSPAVRSRRAGPLKIIIRVAVGAGVFAFLLVRSDPAELARTVRDADLLPLLLGAVCLFVGLIVSAFRWRAYLDALEIPLPLRALLRLYLVGTFFNAFLPTGVGGDAYKALRLRRRTETSDTLAPAFASVFLDRFAGVIGLALIGLAGVVWELIAGDPELSVAGVSFVLCAAILTVALVLLVGGERLLGRGRLIKDEGLGGRLRRAMRAIQTAGRHPTAAARGYLLGLLFQLLVLGYHLAVSRALGLQGVSIARMTSVVVVSSIATMIPLSINGLGFREGAYIWALGQFGVASHEATAFALLILAIVLLTSAVGGVVYLIAGGEVAGVAEGDARTSG